MSTDLAIIETGLVVTNDAGEATGVVTPGTGEIVSFNDLAGLASWKRTIMDIKYEALRPVEHLVDEAIYHHLDGLGSYTASFENGLAVTGESRGTWENAEQVDGVGLHADLLTLAKRNGTVNPDVFAAAFFKVEMTLTADGKRRLKAMGGDWAAALPEHTTPAARSRKAPSVKRAK